MKTSFKKHGKSLRGHRLRYCSLVGVVLIHFLDQDQPMDRAEVKRSVLGEEVASTLPATTTSSHPLASAPALSKTHRCPEDGKPQRFYLEGSIEPMRTHEWSCLPPFSVLRPGATQVSSALLCYTVSVPTTQHQSQVHAGRGGASARGKPPTYGRG